MFSLINDVSSYRTAVNSWARNGAPTVAGGYLAPDGTQTAFRVTASGSVDNFVWHPSITVVDSQYKFGVWIWTDSGQPFYEYQLFIIGVNTYGVLGEAQVFSISNVPTFFTTKANSVLFSSGLEIRVDIPNNASAGQYCYVWNPHVAPIREYIDLYPEWSTERVDETIRTEHRGRSGKRYVYKWGSFKGLKMPVKFVTTSNAATINDSFWTSNKKLLVINTPGDTVLAVQIINKKRPLNRFVKPYTQYFQGTIELETY